MELTQLNHFRRVAETENMTKAASELGVTASALSRSIAKLEDELGCQLFERTKNTITLNELGKTALRNAKTIFFIVDKIRHDAVSGQEQRSSLRIGGSIPATMRAFVPSFNQRYPEFIIITEILRQTDILPALLNRSIDIGFSGSLIRHKETECIPCSQERLMVSVPKGHPLYEEESITLKQLNGEHILCAKSFHNLMDDIIDTYAKNQDITIKRILQSDYMIFKELTRTSNYLFFSSNHASSFLEKDDNRKLLNITDKELIVPVFITYLKKNAALVADFREWLRTNYTSTLK